MKTPKIHFSKDKAAKVVGFSVGCRGISYSNAIAAGDAVIQGVIKEQERLAQHGICKTKIWCGREVPEEWQSLPRPEISKLMMASPDYKRSK